MLHNNHDYPDYLCATNTVSETFHCTTERAFKTPILGDATRILIGWFGVKLISGFTRDETWGTVGGSRVPIANSFLTVRAGEQGYDQIFVRDENEYWKWGVSKFGSAFFFCTENCGEWWVTGNHNGTVSVKWKYTWFSKNIFMQPLNWLFVKLFWSVVMRNGTTSIKQMAEVEMEYLYDR